MFACFLKVAELFLKPNTEILIWPACATVSVLCRGTHFCRIASTLRSGLLYSVGWGSDVFSGAGILECFILSCGCQRPLPPWQLICSLLTVSSSPLRCKLVTHL